MEEADLDELEWMACQQFPPEEDEDFYDGYDDVPPPDDPPRPVIDIGAVNSSTDDSSRKRLWIGEDLASQESSGNAGTAKKSRGSQSDPLVTSSKRPLFIPGMTSTISTQRSVFLSSSPAVISKEKHVHNGKQSSTLFEEPLLLPLPASVEEARPMSPSRDEEKVEVIKEVEVPLPCKLPYRRAADIDGEYFSITGIDGDRVYAAKSEPAKASNNASTVRSKDLLGEPIAKMIERLERETFEQVIAASDKKIHLEGDTNETAPSTEHEDLWVDKYAPRSFTELLSDEQTNREVLRWLKQWDSCVFGAKIHSTSEEVLTSLRRQATQAHGNGKMGGRGSFNNTVNMNASFRSDRFNSDSAKNLITEEKSTLDRPDEKVLLLCGPPGLGKTTLAHVVARHCGYRVVEINASDDRVAATLQAKILDAIQMKSVLGDNRPNCLVIDEIDGALSGAEGKGAIDALLEIINAEKKLSLGKENEMEEGFVRKNSRKKGAPVRRLSRPVICICNDLYAPALRNLRQVARVHVFVQPSISRVVSRLKYICGREGYKTNARALSALASHTECDIRSCLNTLQFLNRKKQNLKTMDVGSQVIGRKDMTSSIFDIWGEIFHKRKGRAGKGMQGMVEIPEIGNQDHKDFVRRYGLFSNHGDYDLTMNGVHENILHMRYLDPSLHKTVEALEWMGDSEIFSFHIMAKQQFHLLAYQPLPLIAIRGLVAQQERPDVKWPKLHQSCRTEQAVKKEMLSSWLGAMTASISRSLSPICLGLDMVTPLLSIITPPTIRPVAAQLLTPKEKDEVTQLVDTMLGFGISYRHPKQGMLKSNYGMEGQSALALDPPIDALVKFKDYTPSYHQLSSTLCQMLAHEVEIERIRRDGAIRESKMGAVNPTPKPNVVGGSIKKDDGRTKTALKSTESSSQLSKEETVVANKKSDVSSSKIIPMQQEKPQPHRPTNFFERFKKSAQTGVTADVKAKEKLATLQRDSRPVLYRYHEVLSLQFNRCNEHYGTYTRLSVEC
ncbi:hypothetical protein M758_9G148800 [Ceratodon purpureus]|nr:hypothetical protein M758_9G148800 [Ceratodon purpureus]